MTRPQPNTSKHQSAVWARKHWSEHRPLPESLQKLKEALLSRPKTSD